MKHYVSEIEIEKLVGAFEACDLDQKEFKHREHLTVAIWYVQTLGREAALDRMRSGLRRFLNHLGVDAAKYSEAITVFWIDKVAQRLSEFEQQVSLLEKCNRIVEATDFQPQIFAKQHGSKS